jgi:SAM-dependent methyltransferase
VLDHGGRYVFSVWDRYGRHGRIADEIAGRFFPVDPPQFYRTPSSYYKIDPIKDSLAEAGFTDLKVSVLSREKEVMDFGFFARGLVYGNPLIDMIRTRGGVDPDQVVNALARALRQEFGDRGRIPLQAIMFEAKRL